MSQKRRRPYMTREQRETRYFDQGFINELKIANGYEPGTDSSDEGCLGLAVRSCNFVPLHYSFLPDYSHYEQDDIVYMPYLELGPNASENAPVPQERVCTIARRPDMHKTTAGKIGY